MSLFSFLTPPRVDHDELLDEHDAPRAEMERSLRDLRLINWYFGGVRIYRSLVRRFRPLQSIVDIGAGTADLLESVANVPLRVGVDFKIDHLLYLRDRTQVHAVVADAARLPFRSDSVDLLTSSHFFHHFDGDENVVLLNEALRVARRGVAVNDTRRHYVPLLFMQLVGALRLIGPITRHDGPASVRRGYTIGEAKEVAAKTSALKAKVIRAFPWRFAILLWKRPSK